MSGPFPSAWQAGIDGSRADRRAERLAATKKERANAEAKKHFPSCDHDVEPEHDPRVPWGFEAYRCKKCGHKFHIPKGEAV
jgi:hypothetical protein